MLPRRRRATQFARAADGSMTLLEHLQELRSRLFKASLAVLAGMIIGWFLARPVLNFITQPYCALMTSKQAKGGSIGQNIGLTGNCSLLQTGITDVFTLELKIALYLGLIFAGPVWLYQLWAFIAPGLHKHERKWAYWFTGVAAPLFAAGAALAYFIIARGLEFLLQFTPSNVTTALEISGYVKFVTNFMLIIGVAFEFPLIVALFNIAGFASAKKLLGWWRIAVFLLFAFAAVTVPTPDPFTMSAMGGALCSLYFGAVLFAFFNDRRRARKHRQEFGDIADDDMSPLEYDPEPVEAGAPVDTIEPVAPARPIARSYDDMT
jgi:sec-independent protein translocase protein TatC